MKIKYQSKCVNVEKNELDRRMKGLGLRDDSPHSYESSPAIRFLLDVILKENVRKIHC